MLEQLTCSNGVGVCALQQPTYCIQHSTSPQQLHTATACTTHTAALNRIAPAVTAYEPCTPPPTIWLLAGKLTEQGKDKVEEQVGQAVRAITQHLDALKDGVVAAQQPADGRQPLINEHSAAHLHGAVSLRGRDLHAVGRRPRA